MKLFDQIFGEKNYVDFILFPDFDTVFTETSDKARFVFIPLVSIQFRNHSEYGNKKFHIVSLWDTGNYEKEYFGKCRTDVNVISFEIINNKISFSDEIVFPRIDMLPDAFEIIKSDFEDKKQYYFDNLEYNETTKKLKRGQGLILKEIPDFGDFEAKFYFERITSYLLAKERLKLYGKLNPMFNINNYYVSMVEDKNTTEQDFNKIGKSTYIDSFLTTPKWEQTDESPVDQKFIGQIDEWYFLAGHSTKTFLFVNKEQTKQTQIFQWD